MDEQQQYSTCSCPDRHPAIIKFYENKEPSRVLSVGCSVGHELLFLKKYFPRATIVGSEINDEARALAKEAVKSLSDVHIFSPKTELDLIQSAGPYDLITCFNVACIFPSPTLLYPYDRFEGLIEHMVGLLTESGEIACFGTNYSIKELVDARPKWGCEAWATRVKQSQVPMYTSAGDKIPPDSSYFFRVRKTQSASRAREPAESATLVERKYAGTESPIRIGVLGYSRSTNIGDYMQTLAQINILSFFYNSKWTFESPELEQAFKYFAALKYGESGNCKQTAFNRAHLVWVDRDAVDEYYSDEPVWVIMNGWYAHKKEEGTFAWPPSVSIRPLFISFHCQDALLLASDKSLEYFKKHEPIGCRDPNTAELLKSKGIRTWFSGCLTSTLDSEGRARARTKHTYVIDCKIDEDSFSEIAVGHLQKDVRDNSFDYALMKTLSYFREYTSSSKVRTSRLHAFIPCVASGTRAEFVSPHGGLTPEWLKRSRFEGLIQRCLNDFERELGALLITNRLVDTLMAVLVDRLPAEDVYNVFEKINKDRYFPIEGYREEYFFEKSFPSEMLRLSFPAVIQSDSIPEVECWKARCEGAGRLNVIRKSVLKPFINQANVLITADSGYADIAPVMLSSLCVNNPHILWKVHCIQRGLSTEEVLKIRRAGARFPNLALFMSQPPESFDRYHTHLTHVSESCLDRLFIETLDYGEESARVIYMDLDMLVLGALDPLLELSTGRKGLCARSSLKSGTVSAWIKNLGRTDISYSYSKSFNAGIFVADLDVLRANAFTPFVLGRARDTGINDQIILNLYATAQYAELPSQFNVFIGQEKPLIGSSKILHFVGSNKPWLGRSEPYLNDLWEYYASGAFMNVREIMRG